MKLKLGIIESDKDHAASFDSTDLQIFTIAMKPTNTTTTNIINHANLTTATYRNPRPEGDINNIALQITNLTN